MQPQLFDLQEQFNPDFTGTLSTSNIFLMHCGEFVAVAYTVQ